MVYLILYFTIAILGVGFVEKKTNENFNRINNIEIYNSKKRTIFTFLCLAVLSIIGGMRADSVGIDTKSYAGIYERFSYGMSVSEVRAFATTIEYGYLYFAKAIVSICKSRFFFFGCNGLIIYYCYLTYAKKNSKDYLTSVLIFISLYYTSTFNVMRQYISLGVMLLALQAIKDKRLLLMSVFIAISILIHHSSIIFLPGILLYFIPNKSRNILKIELIGILILMIIRIPSVFNKLLVVFRYNRLLNGVHFVESDSNGIMALVYLTIVGVGLFLAWNERYHGDEEFAFNLINTSIGAGFALLAVKNEMFARAGAGYLSFSILLIPAIIDKLFNRKKDKEFVNIVLALLLGCAMYVNAGSYNYSTY